MLSLPFIYCSLIVRLLLSFLLLVNSALKILMHWAAREIKSVNSPDGRAEGDDGEGETGESESNSESESVYYIICNTYLPHLMLEERWMTMRVRHVKVKVQVKKKVKVYTTLYVAHNHLT